MILHAMYTKNIAGMLLDVTRDVHKNIAGMLLDVTLKTLIVALVHNTVEM